MQAEIEIVQQKADRRWKDRLKIPASLKDVTISQFAKVMDLEVKLGEADNRILDLDMKRMDLDLVEVMQKGKENKKHVTDLEEQYGSLEQDEYFLLVDKAKIIQDQLKVLCDKSEHKKIDNIPLKDAAKIKASIIVSAEESEPTCIFTLKGGTKSDIERIRQEIAEGEIKGFTAKKIARLRIKKLAKGEFVLVPAREALFKSKIATDQIRKQYPTLEDPLMELYKKVKGDMSKLAPGKGDGKDELSLEELRQRQIQIRQIEIHKKKFDAAVYSSAANLLSYASVPINEPYIHEQAVARVPAFMELDVDTASRLLAFFCRY